MPPENRDVPAGARAPRPNARRELVEREIKEHAARLFAERGLAGTTLQHIADATGLTRPALYYYVANKDELFAELVSEIADAPGRLLHEINEIPDLTPVAKLHRMAESLAMNQTSTPERFRLLIRSEAELPDDLAEGYRLSRRRVLRELIEVIDAGITDGSFRAVDPRTAALGIVGMINWIAWWYRPGDDERAIAGQLADMAVRSVRTDSDTAGPPTPDRLIGDLRAGLDRLERLVRSEPPAATDPA